MDVDYGSASPEVGAAYLGMLCIDALLGVVGALETLTNAAVEPEEDAFDAAAGAEAQAAAASSPAALPLPSSPSASDRHARAGGGGGSPLMGAVERATAEAMVGAVWRPMLGTLGSLLAATSGEALVVQLLKVCSSGAAS